MADRNDVVIDFNPSPRIAIVDAPSTEFSAQDIVDTLRVREESFRGMTENKLLNASGKEELGGGVKVGVTVELQDTQIAFEGRTSPAQVGTVTTASTPPVSGIIDLYDTSASFQTNNIARGSLVINYTDQSIAEVFSVESEIHLRANTLVNGTDNQFDIGDDYQVFNIIQCEVLGGNVVAVDNINAELSAILPTAFTQVVRTASSSATLQEQSSIQYASFNGGVTIDVINGTSGIVFPTGTPLQPSNNLVDALTIAKSRGFNVFYIKGILPIGSLDPTFNYVFIGDSPVLSSIIVAPGVSIAGTEFRDVYVEGELSSGNIIVRCLVGNITNFSGGFSECTLTESIALAGSNPCYVNDCKSGTNGTVIFDLGVSGQSLTVSNYNGEMKLINKTGIDNIEGDINSGLIELDSTISNGDIIFRGVGKMIDNSTGSAIVVNEMVSGAEVSAIHRILELLRPHHVATGNVWYWDPHNGVDTNSGDHINRAVRTFAKAQDLATDSNHDLIICVPGNPTGKTITNEIIVISKNYLMVRGPGRDFFINNTTDDSQDAVLITGDGVEISGMILGTNPTNTEWVVHSIGDFALVKDIWISDSSNGVLMEAGEYNIIQDARIHHNFGVGLKYSGSVVHSDIIDSHIGNNTSDGILIDNPGGHEVNLKRTVVHSNGGYGINISTNTSGVIINDTMTVFDNALGNINDQGTSTFIEQSIKDEITATAVWEDSTAVELLDIVSETIKFSNNRTLIDPDTFTLTVFDDDLVTPIHVYDLKDENGVSSVTTIFERVPQ